MLHVNQQIQNIKHTSSQSTHTWICMNVCCMCIYIYKDQTKTKCTRQIVKEDNKFKGRKKPQ